MPTKELSRATGRRKEAVARVRLIPGEGNFIINGSRSLPDYFPNLAVRRVILEPLEILELTKNYDVLAPIEGGGTAGQAGALRHGISRALVALDPELRPQLKKAGFLTRDSRIIERKKYGLKKARKAPQYSKR
ncbi:MAG TPA: 30S ribosomal protein S9 [Actinomycetota bacterium]|nr:30S ribosomal protein S9 [Actinomycetota bacterium]